MTDIKRLSNTILRKNSIIITSNTASASILSYLLHDEERKIFAKIYLVSINE